MPASPVAAQPVDPTVAGRPAEPAARAQPETALTPAGAVLLSVGATAGAVGAGYLLDRREGDDGLGAVVIASGLLVGPSVGNLAVGNRRGALIGTGVRTLGLALAAGGVATSLMNHSAGGAHVAAVVGGVVLGGGGVVYDLVSAGRYAGRVTVAPSVDVRTRAPVAVVRVGL